MKAIILFRLLLAGFVATGQASALYAQCVIFDKPAELFGRSEVVFRVLFSRSGGRAHKVRTSLLRSRRSESTRLGRASPDVNFWLVRIDHSN